MTFRRSEFQEQKENAHAHTHTQKLALHSKSDQGYLRWHALLMNRTLYIRIYAKKKKSN